MEKPTLQRLNELGDVLQRLYTPHEHSMEPHVKEIVYFDGYRKVSAHLENHPEHYSLLMYGKVSLEMIPSLSQLRRKVC